jgi:hypothetical protein
MAEIQTDTLGSREDTLRFLDVVALFGQQAMISLGKLANPMTNKAEKNLPAARLFIDTLEMIERKTHGNLNSDESKVLQATLTDLRLMFVEESKAPEADKPKTDTQQAPAQSEDQETDESKVKFHKKYD